MKVKNIFVLEGDEDQPVDNLVLEIHMECGHKLKRTVNPIACTGVCKSIQERGYFCFVCDK